MSFFEGMSSNIPLMMGMSGLAGNYGRNSRAAFSNSIGGMLQGMQAAEMMGLRKRKYEAEQNEMAKLKAAADQIRANNPSLAHFPDEQVVEIATKQQMPTAAHKNALKFGPEGSQPYLDFLKNSGGGVNVNLPKQSAGQVYFSPQDAKNFVMKDGNPVPPSLIGQPWTAIGDQLRYKQAPLAGENAGKLAMMDAAAAAIPGLEKILFGGDPMKGEINRGALFGKAAAQLTIPLTDIPLIPGYAIEYYDKTKGGTSLAQGYEMGIQGITRTETGAAMPDTELGNTRKRFEPGAGDSDFQIRQKHMAYKLFINNAREYLREGFKDRPSADNINFEKLMSDASSQLKNAGVTDIPSSNIPAIETGDPDLDARIKGLVERANQ